MHQTTRGMFAALAFAWPVWSTPVEAAGELVYVIAKSVSTSMEARSIAASQGWQVVPLRQADYALVVVRSSLDYPLSGSYESVFELEEDADNQLNISGPNFVVYLFSLDDNLRPTELDRVSYPVRE